MGAHWDTVPDTEVMMMMIMMMVKVMMMILQGADDNSSGVAALLELARALSAADCRNTNTVIIVAFDLEEQGGTGSKQFVQVTHLSSANRDSNKGS